MEFNAVAFFLFGVLSLIMVIAGAFSCSQSAEMSPSRLPKLAHNITSAGVPDLSFLPRPVVITASPNGLLCCIPSGVLKMDHITSAGGPDLSFLPGPVVITASPNGLLCCIPSGVQKMDLITSAGVPDLSFLPGPVVITASPNGLLCCMIFGMISIILSSLCNGFYNPRVGEVIVHSDDNDDSDDDDEEDDDDGEGDGDPDDHGDPVDDDAPRIIPVVQRPFGVYKSYTMNMRHILWPWQNFQAIYIHLPHIEDFEMLEFPIDPLVTTWPAFRADIGKVVLEPLEDGLRIPILGGPNERVHYILGRHLVGNKFLFHNIVHISISTALGIEPAQFQEGMENENLFVVGGFSVFLLDIGGQVIDRNDVTHAWAETELATVSINLLGN
nr:hypothetical protein Iba_chr11fCG8350 [Ipomoea batatas]